MTKISAVVLAAGNGSRFGGDKLLHPLEIQDEHGCIQQKAMGLISSLNVQPHVNEVICVVRPHDTRLMDVFHSHQLTTVRNPDYETGLSSSIKVGVQAAKPDHAIMICLADMPFIKHASYQAIVNGFCTQPEAVCRPVFLNKQNTSQPGHPVIFAPKLRNNLMELSQDRGAQMFIQSLSIHTIPLDDSGVIQDIDQKSDLGMISKGF